VTVGLTYVSGTGDVIHGGGRVVKNVAGFDLVRLSIGAWGTLGVITSATVRLRARPEADHTVAVTLPSESDALGTLLSMIRAASLEPLAAELLSATCAQRIGLGNRALLLVRLAGNAVGVHHQGATLARLAVCDEVAPATWIRLLQSDPADGAVVRVSRRPSELSRLWLAATATPDIDAHASLYRGVVRLRLPASIGPLRGFDALDRQVVETMPEEWRDRSAPPAPNDSLSRRMRDAFDPARVLNRGILGSESA
jgi:glycolate oxidase FAD binding subunit